jgi:hemolysin activation/secretion protein
MTRNIKHALWATLAWLLSTGAHAQVPADAGALQQRIERERQSNLPTRVTPLTATSPALMQGASGMAVQVKAFTFRGNHLLSDQQLTAVVSAFVNRSLDFAQLQAAAAAVATAYSNSGWVVDAYLPSQDIREGVVTIEITEAVFGAVKVEGKSQHVRAQRLLAIVAAQQMQGQPVNTQALDRALLLADDLAGVAVSGALRVGSLEKETDIVLKVTDEPSFFGDARLDNTGARSTGSSRAAANFYFNSPMGAGDQLTVNMLGTADSRYARIGYDLPLGSDGWRLSGNAAHLAYELRDAPGNGSSHTWGLEARYPMLRARMTNLFLVLTVDHKEFDNRLNGASVTQYKTDASGISLTGNRFDDSGGGGANSAAVTWVNGRRHNQQGSTDGQFNKVRYAASRQQTITHDFSAYVSWDGQYSRDQLDTSEAYYLGGANGVRAYPSNEGRGSSGDLAKLELRWRARSELAAALFYDHGRVRNHDGSPSYSLKGAGVALTWQSGADVNLTATLARRIGNNPNAGLSGRDEDGSLNKNRIWLTGSWAF